ncbi:homoprotocatechuate degradation operon regulator HpaR [Herbaspirillum sp. NPDC087042]|uniref:homoprotocatechuate degradation operon regulator HpaR n=1 Tax=Herbaspirillum sp. NPDC087042 TaxID=3364004 RepID=UPI00380A7CC2
MDKSFKHRNLALLLLQARERVMVNFRRILNHYGLTEQQWRVIRAISDFNGPMEQWQICETCQILSPSLAGVLVRMEDMELVERNRVDTDQRRMLVSLTRKSRALIKEIAPRVEQQYARLEDSIGVEVVGNLYRALDDFLADEEPVELIALPDVAPRKKATATSAGRRKAVARQSAD